MLFKNSLKKKKELWYFGYPIREYLPLLHFFLCHFAAYIILDSADINNIWVIISAFYLGISFFLYYYSTEKDKQDRNREIAKLKQEIGRFESIRESDKHIIKLLKQENERLEQQEHNIGRSDAIET